MRNLKRALSLALASIMLLGMMVTGAGAASNSFTDFDQIVNQEAAEVTSGLGIFDGYTDGSFGPEKVVTRAEMAVIICKLLNGSDVDPGNFTGISKFTDVPAWAEGYVNYCAAAGIVVGVGEGKFNPSATVTTVEAATMLLKALGYFTEEDKLQADWKTVVTGRATGMHLYGALTLAVDEGLTRDNVAELVFNTLFAQRVAYDDNRQLYVKNTNRDVVVTNGTQDYLNTFAENTFHMWVVDGLVTANSFTDDDLSETTNNAPRTNVVFDAAAAQDYPATTYQGSTGSEYPFEYTTGLDMIGHAARVYYRMERNAPVVFAIADRATKVAYITYNSNNAALAEAANAAGFRRNTINQINEDDYKVNYAWDVTYRSLFGTAKAVDLTGDKTIDPAKTLLVISNSSDSKVDYVIVLDQYLDTVKRVVTRNDVTEYDLTTVDGVDQNILHGQAAQGDYVVVTDIGKSGDMLNFEPAEKLSANITKITGKSDSTATVKSIVADGTTYVGSPVYDYRVGNSALDDTTDFEDIATIGEATLLLDFQGKCIGLAQPESTPNYAYAAQFGVWHTGGSLNTEFKLTVKLYFLDGTSGVYLVNTDDSQNSNTFYKLKMGTTESAAESVRDRLNGGNGTGAGYVDPTKTYDTNICVDNGTLWLRGKNVIETSDTNGLGIYKVSVRADDTVVMTKLGSNGDGAGHDSSIIPATDETKLISGHSTFVKQNGSNLTYKNTDKVMYQNNKTVYFYVDGSYNTELSVGAKYGVSNAISITNNKDKDDNTRKESFEQILLKGDARTNGLAVEAVLIYGYDMGSSETLYFYRQNDYDIQSKDASSRAGERNYTITYHLYTADGEPYEATFDNNGKYYDMETAKNTVENKPTGFYAIGSTDLDGKWTSNDPDTVLYKKNGENKDKPGAEGATNVYVLNAEAYHDTYADNLYTLSEVVGGIIPSTAKVVSTVDGCDFDSVSEIARACDNGHLVRISYTYSTSDYKVKTVFITDFKRDAGNLGGDRNPGASLWSSYDASMDRILVFDDVTKNPRSTLAEQLSSAEKALTDAGFTIVDSRTAGMYNQQNGTYSWTIEATRVVGNTTRRYFFTGDPAGGQIYGNWYTGAIYTTKVLVNGNLAGYYVPNNTTPAKITVRTVNANKTYDVKWNNSAVVGSVTADEKAVISYLLPVANTGYTVNFVMNTNPVKPIEGLTGKVNAALDGVSATFDGNKENVKFSAKVGEKIDVVITGKTEAAPEGRGLGDTATSFVVGTYYAVTINGVTKTVKCETANKLTVPYTIQESDAKGLVINVTAIVEAEAPVTGKITVSANTGYTPSITEISAAGKATITVDVPETDTADATYDMEVTSTVTGLTMPAKLTGVTADKLTFDVDVTADQLKAGGSITITVSKNGAEGKVTLNVTDGYTLSANEITTAGKTTITVTVPETDAKDAKYTLTVDGVVKATEVAASELTFEVEVTEEDLAAGKTIEVEVTKKAGEVKVDPTVRAVFDPTTKAYKLYSYKAEAMTEDDVKSAISAATGKTVTNLKFDTTQTSQYGVAEFESGNPVKIFTDASASGSSVNPIELNEVTMPNGDKKYLYNGEKVTGLTASKEYIDVKTGIVASSDMLTADAKGEAAITLTTGVDVVLAEALTMPATLTNLKVFAQYGGKESEAGASKLIPVGSTLVVRYTNAPDAGKNIEITVESEKKSAVADENGMAQVTCGPVNSMAGATLAITAAVNVSYTVTFNGKEVAADAKVGDEIALTGVTPTELFKPTAADDPTLTAINGAGSYETSTGMVYKVVAADAIGDKIDLFSAISVATGVTGAKIYQKWDATNGPSEQVAASAAQNVAKGTKLYLVADDENTIFAAVAGSGITLKNEQAPSGAKAGVWSFELTKPVQTAAGTFEVVAALPAADGFGYATDSIAAASGLDKDNPKDVTATGVKAKDVKNITVAWDSTTGAVSGTKNETITPSGKNYTVTLGALDMTGTDLKFEVSTNSTNALAAADSLGSVVITITCEGLTISATFAVIGTD